MTQSKYPSCAPLRTPSHAANRPHRPLAPCRHFVCWTRLPIFHPVLCLPSPDSLSVPPPRNTWEDVQALGLGGATGVEKDGMEAGGDGTVGEGLDVDPAREVVAFVRGRWPEDKYETLWQIHSISLHLLRPSQILCQRLTLTVTVPSLPPDDAGSPTRPTSSPSPASPTGTSSRATSAPDRTRTTAAPCTAPSAAAFGSSADPGCVGWGWGGRRAAPVRVLKRVDERERRGCR